MKQLLSAFLLFSFISLTNFSLKAQELQGWIIDSEENVTIPGVHVVNKTTLEGVISENDGSFKIDLSWGDTIVFSNIAFQYFYFIYNDSATALTDVVIKMKEQNYLLNEVSIFSYKLTSNKDEEIVFEKPFYPEEKDLEDGTIIKASPANPAEYLYNLFGSKPRQLRMLAQLKAEDAYREKLKESNNRESVVNITGLSRRDLEAFMFYCKYSSVQMKVMTDYDFLTSVQKCYNQYVREKELDDFLNQFD